MRLTRKKAKALESAVKAWIEENVVSQEEASRLLKSVEIVGFDWKRLAKYSFWISIICIIISISALLADEALMKLLAKIFNAPAIIKCLFFALIAAILFYVGAARKARKPETIFSNEAIFFLGILATAASIAFLGEAIDRSSEHYSLLLLLASIIYSILGLWFPSKLVWIFGLLSLGSWFGAETGYISGWGAYYLGMNYPLRFVLFGLVLAASSAVFDRWENRSEFMQPTRVMGLLYLFIALWILSIFGNYDEVSQWQRVKQIELFHWSLLFAAASIAAIYYGLKHDDGVTRGFGLTFLFINLYTRFFEFFWGNLHKAVFFALLAGSFWYLGSHAEKIWGLEWLAKADDET
jgi:uncharacterized integral membrane protein